MKENQGNEKKKGEADRNGEETEKTWKGINRNKNNKQEMERAMERKRNANQGIGWS